MADAPANPRKKVTLDALRSHPDFNRVFEQERAKWQAILQPLIDACDRCQKLTAADYAVTINVRD